MLAKLMLYRPGINRVGGQDVINGAISIRAGSGMPRCCCQRVCVCFQAVDISQPHRCHSNTDERPCYFTALAGSIRVIYSLLDVRTAEEGCSCVN